jgi:hypothetical protein
MKMRLATVACCTALYLMFAPPCHAQQANPQEVGVAGGYKYLVEIKSVIDRSPVGGDKVLYEIRYRYEFGGLESVFVTGLGVVPAKRDEVTYLTEEKKLEFRKSAAGEVLVSVPLRVTAATQSGGGPELPPESQFSEAALGGVWSQPGSFSDHAYGVIQKYFTSGVGAYQRGDVSYYITTYRTLSIPDGKVRGQVAVMVSQPYSADGGMGYRVQYVVRDRPRLSGDWRYGSEISEQTRTAVTDFIGRLVAELGGNR